MVVSDETKQKLINLAVATKAQAYCPYSKFQVGSALMTTSGHVFKGCNFETANYAGTICGERSAISQMVAEGQYEIDTIIVTTNSKNGQFDAPCGHCRQAIREFAPEDKNQLTVFLVNGDLQIKETTIEELLPMSFGPDSLGLKRPNSEFIKTKKLNGTFADSPVKLNGVNGLVTNGH